MRTGLFCTYENPGNDYKAAYAEQTKLVQLIESLGFDEVWVAEHHFNPGASSASCLNILTYLAACTTRIRLGAAAVLLPFHDPIRVAEDVATLDILSGGRFDFGVAKGGPFAVQNKHFGVNKDESRARACEALTLIQKMLTQDHVCFEGDCFKVEDLSLTPKPVQHRYQLLLRPRQPIWCKSPLKTITGSWAVRPFRLMLCAKICASIARRHGMRIRNLS